MSGSFLFGQTPQEQQAQLDADKSTLRVLSGVPAGVAGLAYPDPQAQGWKSYLPSAVTGLYGIASLLGRGVQNVVASPSPSIPPLYGPSWDQWKSQELPGGEEAREMALRGTKQAMHDIAAVPQSEGERIAQEAAGGAGSMLVGAGVPLAASRGIRLAQQALLPASGLGPKGTAALAGAGAGLSGGIEAVLGPDEARAAEMQQAALALSLGQQTAPTQQPLASPTAQAQVIEPQGVELIKPDLTQAQDGPELSVRQALDDSAWTWGDVIVTGLASAAVLAGGGKALQYLRNVKAENISVLSKAYNADEARRVASPGLLTTPHEPMPAPPGVLSTDRLAGQFTDSSVPLQRIVEETTNRLRVPDPAPPPANATAQELAMHGAQVQWVKQQNERLAKEAIETQNRFSLQNNTAAINSQMQSFAATSVDPVSGRTFFAPIRNHWEDVSKLAPAQRDAYTRIRYIADELDNRRNSPIGAPHNFSNYSTGDLAAEVQRVRAQDPAVRKMLDDRAAIAHGMADWLRHRGMLTQQEAQLIKQAHPNFMPNTNFKGLIDNPLTERSLEPVAGIDNIPVPAYELDKQHFDALFRAVNRNDAHSTVIQNMLDFQKQTPGMAPFVKEVQYRSPTGSMMGHNGGPTMIGQQASDEASITVRIGGRLRSFKIMDPAMFSWMDPARQPLVNGIGNEMRALAQSGMVGMFSLATGTPASVRIGMYNGMFSGVTRPSGMATGYLDKAMQGVTGGKFGVRGDPTGTFIAQPIAMAADIGSFVMNGIGDGLRPGNSWWINNALRRYYGDAAVDGMHYNLKAAYEKTLLAERRRAGVTGSAGTGSAEQPGIQPGSHATSKASPLNNMVPDLFRSYDPKLLYTDISLPIGKYFPMMIKTKEVIKEVMQLISESHLSSAYRLNRPQAHTPGAVDWKLARETRNLTGDVGQQGTNKAMQYAMQTVPFGSPTLQGGRRFLNAFKEHPFATSVGITNALILPSLAAYMLARSQGDDAVNHLMEQISSDRFSAALPLIIGQDPLVDRVDIPTDPTLRVFQAMALSMIHDTFGAMHNAGEEGQQAFWTIMSDLFNKHVSTDAMGKIRGALVAAVEPSPPPLASALFAGADKAIPQGYLDRTIQGQNPLLSTDKARTIAGTVANIDPLTGADMSSSFMKMFSGLMAGFGHRVQQAHLQGGYAATSEKGSDLEKAGAYMSGVGSQLRQNFRDTLPMFNNTLWKNETQLATRQPFVESIERKMAVLKGTVGSSTALNIDGAMTGPRGLPVPQDAQLQAKLPPDPQMRQLYVAMNHVYNRANKADTMAVEVRKQMDALATTGAPVELQRTQRNILTREYEAHMHNLGNMLTYWEHALSQKAGRLIRFDDVDFKKGMEQFKPLYGDEVPQEQSVP